MKNIGQIELPTTFSESDWQKLISSREELHRVKTAVFANPMTGDDVDLYDPPNLLADVVIEGQNVGSLRSTRLFPHVIEFRGTGEKFLDVIHQEQYSTVPIALADSCNVLYNLGEEEVLFFLMANHLGHCSSEFVKLSLLAARWENQEPVTNDNGF